MRHMRWGLLIAFLAWVLLLNTAPVRAAAELPLESARVEYIYGEEARFTAIFPAGQELTGDMQFFYRALGDQTGDTERETSVEPRNPISGSRAERSNRPGSLAPMRLPSRALRTAWAAALASRMRHVSLSTISTGSDDRSNSMR